MAAEKLDIAHEDVRLSTDPLAIVAERRLRSGEVEDVRPAREPGRSPRLDTPAKGDECGWKVVASVEETPPGSPLDARLRREQTRAILELVASTRLR